MTSELHPCTLAMLSVIPLVASVAPEQAQPHVGFVLSRLVSDMYAPSTYLATSWTDFKLSYASREPALDDKCVLMLAQVERSCVELLRGGIDSIADWVHHDLLPLCSSEDDEPSAISRTPILRSSPLGVFVRKTCLALDRMGFEQLGKWCETTTAWFACTSVQNLIQDDEPVSHFPSKQLSNPQALLAAALNHFRHANYDLLALSLEECFKISRSVGDVETLEGCWSLLKRIPEQDRVKFLNGLGRSSSTSNDPDGKGKNKVLGFDPDDLSNPHDLLFQTYESLLKRDDSVSIAHLFHQLLVAQTLAVAGSANPPGQSSSSSSSSSSLPRNRAAGSNRPLTAGGAANGVDPTTRKYRVDLETFATELRFVQSELWQSLGITPISKVYRDLVLEDPSSSRNDDDVVDLAAARLGRGTSSLSTHPTNCQLRLRTLLEQSRRMLEDNDSPFEALDVLLTSVDSEEKRVSLGLTTTIGQRRRRQRRRQGRPNGNGYSEWTRQVLECLERALERSTTGTDRERSNEREEGLETIRATLGRPGRSRSTFESEPLRSAATRLATNVVVPRRTGSTATSPVSRIARVVDLARSRLELTACVASADAARGLIELDQLENDVLVFSSLARSSSSSSRSVQDETMARSRRLNTIELDDDERSRQDRTAGQEDEDEEEEEEEMGEMLAGRKVEAEFWQTRAQVKIVASDYNDETIKANLSSFERSLAIYRDLSLDGPAHAVTDMLESLCSHLSLSDSISAGEAGEWRRRTERYRQGRGQRGGGGWTSREDKEVDWRRVLDIVELVGSLL